MRRLREIAVTEPRGATLPARLAVTSMAAAFACVLALPAAAQTQVPQAQPQAQGQAQDQSSGKPEPLVEPGPTGMPPVAEALDEIHSRGEKPARPVMARYGSCVADRSRDKAAEALRMDFTTNSYRSRMQALSKNNHDCFGRRGSMRGSTLLFAGFIAERLLSDDATPLNVRLARAAARPAPASYAPSDTMAICLVRSLPDQVAALFATRVESPEETAAVAQIAPLAPRCAPDGKTIEITPDGLRAVLATAAYRSLAGAAETTKS